MTTLLLEWGVLGTICVVYACLSSNKNFWYVCTGASTMYPAVENEVKARDPELNHVSGLRGSYCTLGSHVRVSTKAWEHRIKTQGRKNDQGTGSNFFPEGRSAQESLSFPARPLVSIATSLRAVATWSLTCSIPKCCWCLSASPSVPSLLFCHVRIHSLNALECTWASICFRSTSLTVGFSVSTDYGTCRT